MPKSKTRGSLKEHRKRVQTRNNTLRGLRKKMEKEYQEMFNQKMEELKAQYQTENGETINLETKVISDEINVNEPEIVIPEILDEN